MAQSDTLSIKLKFGNRILPMVVARADEYLYREAEKLVNSRFSFYASKYPDVRNYETYLLMAALDIALHCKRMETEVDAAPMRKAIEALIEEVEQSLK